VVELVEEVVEVVQILEGLAFSLVREAECLEVGSF
jgi:hypothetical protein